MHSQAGPRNPVLADRHRRLRETRELATYFIVWANNHFNNLHFRNSLETEKILEMGIGQSLMFGHFLKRKLLK